MPVTKSQLRSTVGSNLRARRCELGLSQQSVGDSVGLSQPQINRIEKGVCSFPADLFAILGEVLRVDPIFFLTPQRSEISEKDIHTLDA
jgi:transcriptional regulator with XRE-family HTH domain